MRGFWLCFRFEGNNVFRNPHIGIHERGHQHVSRAFEMFLERKGVVEDDDLST
jgi:hypothetical protein